jgi:L-amino acid N-acyltransferase
MSDVRLREATDDDLPALRDLYNTTIDETTAAWTEQLETPEERAAWFADRRTAGDPVLVAVDDEQVVGFTAWGWFRGVGRWEGYRHTK